MVNARRAMLAGALGLLACRPELAGRPSLITTDRVLAVSSEPAEATPEAAVSYHALYVGPDAEPDPSGLGWAYCTQNKPLAVTGPISPACLVPQGSLLFPLGNGAAATGELPKDDCRVFGPVPPDTKPGEPAVRPVDPDTTGGYYQPVRLLVPTAGEPDYVVGVTRISCGISGATQEQAADYNRRYLPNRNPALDSLTVVGADGTATTVSPDPQGEPALVHPGEQVTFKASWLICPADPACGDGVCSGGEDATSCADDCGSAPRGCGTESYVQFDPSTRAIVDRREGIRVSWFVTAGELAHDRSGHPEAEADLTETENTWTAPAEAGSVKLWLVVRDDRRGVGWSAYRIDVSP
jgi:hypothetical protein